MLDLKEKHRWTAITQTFQRDAAVGESANVWLVYVTLTNALCIRLQMSRRSESLQYKMHR